MSADLVWHCDHSCLLCSLLVNYLGSELGGGSFALLGNFVKKDSIEIYLLTEFHCLLDTSSPSFGNG